MKRVLILEAGDWDAVFEEDGEEYLALRKICKPVKYVSVEGESQEELARALHYAISVNYGSPE